MPEKKGKFSAIAELRRQVIIGEEAIESEDLEAALSPSAESEDFEAALSPSAARQDTVKGRGRPATGKRSNPEWKLFSHFLKRHTQRAAVARLQAEDDGRDLSDVLQGLLENWLKS